MIINILNLIVLAVTCGAVFWYTVETRRMQRELVHQRQLSNMPSFVAAIKHRGGGDYLQLTNIGKGIAINIAIDDAVIRYPTLQPGLIKFDGTLIAGPGETVFVESTEFPVATPGDSDDGNRNSLTFLGTNAHYDADVKIRFHDIEGTRYLQTLRMGKNGYEHGFVRLDETVKQT